MIKDRIQQIRTEIQEKAKDKCWQAEIEPVEEARYIGELCGITAKQRHPSQFIDIALLLLTYPPEIAYAIVVEFTAYATQLGFIPVGTIMVALGNIDSLYKGMFVRQIIFEEKPELFELVNSRELRIKKAGELLAVAILAASDAKKIYRSNKFDSSVKEVLDAQLKKYDENIALRIIS